MQEPKDYYVKNVEKYEEHNETKIALNTIFTIAGLTLAGVAFGIGDQIFGDLQYLAAFSGVGISSANIRIMKEKLSASKQAKTTKQYIKEKKKWTSKILLH